MPLAYAIDSGDTPKKFDMLPSVSALPIVYSRIGRAPSAFTLTGARPAVIVMPRATDCARGTSAAAKRVVTFEGVLADAAEAATGSDSTSAATAQLTIQRMP